MAANYTYDFFISYRRAGDGKVLARNVNDLLEKYGKSVFLDVDDLTMGYYRQELVDAIEQSQYYILILSKETWREQKSIDDYYREIIKIGEEIKSTDKDVLLLELDKPNDSIPDILAKELEKNDFDLPRKQKVKYSHEKGSHNFEYDLCRALRIEYKETDFAKKFSLVIPDNLLPRDTEADNLINLILQNRIVNLVGVGGSGKSSLAYHCLDINKNDFNEIAYVVVNNNVKDDIVDELNKTLELKFKEDAYTEIIAYLQKNFKSAKTNLLVLDINETADKNKNAEIINAIIKNSTFLEGWKFLILSRENVDTRNRILTYNLNDKDNFDFLKTLFLTKTGERYNDFADFDELFKVIHYNSLLTEQLGLYLNDYPIIATLDEIKTILGETLQEEEMQGMSAQRHDETIISFLKKLIVFDKFDKNEQELLRHFVLWQADYIRYDVIADLLKDIFESDAALINALKSLSRRSILTTQNDDKTLSYKLHGLLADSLRAQIDIEKEDYSMYFRNSKCHFDDDRVIYVLNSCCLIAGKRSKHEIKYQIKLIEAHIMFAHKINDIKLAQVHYNKAVELEKLLPFDMTPEYRKSLANVYNWLASFQEEKLNLYDRAEENYKKAIKQKEELAKIDSKYLSDIASSYGYLALLQQFDLQNNESAICSYKRASDIMEKLSDDLKNQENLAKIYNCLANLLKDYKKDFKSAKEYCYKAIEIAQQLSEKNPAKCLIDLLGYKHSLAEICFDNNEIEVAKSILEEIKPQAEKCLAENPNDDYTKKLNAAIADLLEKIKQSSPLSKH